jgi:hypothetical protein
MSKRKKNKTETVPYESPDADAYRVELEDLTARNRALEMELDRGLHRERVWRRLR